MSRYGRRVIALADGESGEWKALLPPGFANPSIEAGDSGREFLVNDGGPRQRLLDQSIGEARHGDPFRLSAEIESGHEITSELRRIPFGASHWISSLRLADESR